MQTETSLQASKAVRSTLATILLLISTLAAGSIPDTSLYLPQINLIASNGFGPYYLGSHQQNLILAYGLPAGTTKVMFRFVDADSIQVGNAYTVTSASISSASWSIGLDTFNLPLSPQFHLQVTYSVDSVANYYVPYTVYPDTVQFFATAGWGPFITNDYTLADTSWHPVPQLINNFMVKNLPPRTDTVIFQVLAADSTVILTHTVGSVPGNWLDSATYPAVRMDNLPLNTSYLEVLIHGNGTPPEGIGFHKILNAALQKPRLTSKSQGITLVDSIPVVMQDPVAGQALRVDSVKHAVITNGPGLPYFEWFMGPYSFDVITDDFTIEAWLRLDLANLSNLGSGEQYFIQVDSAFAISFVNVPSFYYCAFRLYAIVEGEFYQIYEGSFGNNLIGNQEWHHFAFSLGTYSSDIKQFYLDGNPVTTNVDEGNISYIHQYFPDYNRALKTKPLYLGGNDPTAPSYVTAFDEVRFWQEWLTEENIRQNMHQKILQEYFLAGYWDFDDMRNRLNFISDDSHNNNSGSLMNGAAFIPEDPLLFSVPDTLNLATSNINTDSISIAFLNEDNDVMDSVRIKVNSGKVQWAYDISTLPYTTTHLRVGEICPGSPTGGFQTFFNMKILPPAPIATPQCNWGTYYDSTNTIGNITNPIIVNGFPVNATKVELGLSTGNNSVNNDFYTANSIPFQYSLTLNGTDNYIETSQQIMSPSVYEISLWFKTTSTKGGRLVDFCDTQNGATNMSNDREIIMWPDGSVTFNYFGADGMDTLFAENKYNDGFWHSVTAKRDTTGTVQLYMDNSLVAQSNSSGTWNYPGYWLFGFWGYPPKKQLNEVPAYFFQGSLAYIDIKSQGADGTLSSRVQRGDLLYMLNEGIGTTIHDSSGTNSGTLMGSSQNWAKTSTLSTVIWEHNMLNLVPGTYTFYAKVFYPGGGEQGVSYPLGNYNIQNPLPGYSFAYDLSNGIGYFNEGVSLSNEFSFQTNYTGQGQAGWQKNCIRYYFLTPEHQLIDHNIFKWTTTGVNGSMNIDMGDAPPGSYIDFEVGYITATDTLIESYFSIPILIRPMLAPIISGDFGPFEQAIAPGTMHHNNTFIISTTGLTDLTKITATFYDASGNEIVSVNGVKIDNETWNITQDMSILSPPESYMNISYYLGTHEFLALVSGPYKITIHQTRPDWFAEIGNSAFSNIQENGDIVSFLVATPFDNSYVINNSVAMDIPKWVPLIGESSCQIDMPTAQASLKYIKSQSKLELNGPPVFFQKVFNLGAGNASTLSFGFNYSQNNSYELDAQNNLIAMQNFSTGGSVSSQFDKLVNIVDRVKEIIEAAEVTNPESVIVSPSFELTYTGSFEYSSRQHLMVDSVTGKWGSVGNLDVDANPSHTQAYKNSASYHFYSGALGIEFGIGAEFLEGLISGHFGLDGRFLLGFGESFVTIPRYNSKFLKSFAFQTYGRFYIDILWGWYEKTVWGPKMFYSTTIWGDDMTNAFPPMKKKDPAFGAIPANSSWPGLSDEIRPVSAFTQIPVPSPQSTVKQYKDHLLFNWLEPGEKPAERILRSRSLNFPIHKFSKKNTIETNHNALNSPVSDVIGDSVAIVAWAQSRHTELTFNNQVLTDQIEEFVKSQDIWFAVYDLRNDSLLQTDRVEDDLTTVTSGRAEANPKVTSLSSSRAMITWQVVDVDKNEADIRYIILNKAGTLWTQTQQAVAVSGNSVRSQIKIASPSENRAVMVWLNTSKDIVTESVVMSSQFDGSKWSVPEKISGGSEAACNYLDLCIKGSSGGLVYTKFIEDTIHGHHEKLMLIPWNSDHWSLDETVELFVDSVNHFQLPKLAVYDEGTAVVGVKRERLSAKDANQKISQIDIFKGSLENASGVWHHSAANPFVCDTTRQVSELNFAFISRDTLLFLSHEHAMLAANAVSEPLNGLIFGDPYMNLVLRCVKMLDDGTVMDVDEKYYFTGISEPKTVPGNSNILQCYPNPCSDQTTIWFNIDGSSQIIMELYDIRGIRLATIVHQDLAAGVYEIDLNTSLLQPGTYILRLKFADTFKTIKLVVGR